jgi:hypothetical protein
MSRGIKRPRYIAPSDTRSPMLRLLQDGIHGPDGLVEVNYAEQWRTVFKAQRLGLVDSDCRITDAGRQWLKAHA